MKVRRYRVNFLLKVSSGEFSDDHSGKVCIIVGKSKPQYHHGHGHIVAVVPETNLFKAARQGNTVLIPVQSQAGAHNHA